MIALRDRKGVLWTARLTVGSARQLRELAGLDVMDVVADDGQAEARLSRSPSLAANALYVLCRGECDRRGLTDRAFGRRLKGVPCEQLVDAVRSEVAEFFRVPGPKGGGGSGRQPTPAELWRDAYRMAGAAGVEPDGVTFGELVAMNEGRLRHDWPQTASVLSFIAASSGKRIEATKLDPTGALAEAAAPNRMAITADNLTTVAAIFLGGG